MTLLAHKHALNLPEVQLLEPILYPVTCCLKKQQIPTSPASPLTLKSLPLLALSAKGLPQA